MADFSTKYFPSCYSSSYMLTWLFQVNNLEIIKEQKDLTDKVKDVVVSTARTLGIVNRMVRSWLHTTMVLNGFSLRYSNNTSIPSRNATIAWKNYDLINMHVTEHMFSWRLSPSSLTKNIDQ